MTKIIGIGGCGNNILKFLKKQNYQVKKELYYEFISIKCDEDIQNIKYREEDIIFTVSGLGGNTSGSLTLKLTKSIVDQGYDVKNMIVLPFSVESNTKKAIKELEELVEINQNIEIFGNDALLNEKNKTMSELMREYDFKIFDKITKENQIKWKTFFITTKANDKLYKAIVNFWSKDYKITLLEPEYKRIDTSHMSYIAASRFAFKDEDRSISGIIDIEEIASSILDNYLTKSKQNLI
jgi:hypothetical protein